ncbi:MAG: type IX secretion/gliding motility protein PorT/SprT [Mucilaginibacter sp.]
MIKNVYSTFVLLLLAVAVSSAQSVPAWGGGADQKDLSFGFSFSAVSTYYKIDKTPTWQNPYLDPVNNNQPVTSALTSISSGYLQGFAVGFLTRYRLTEHLEARLTPSIVFTDRELVYTYVTSPTITKTVSTTAADFPLLLKLKSDRLGNFRAYLLGGVKYTQALGSKINTDADAAPIDKLVKNISGYGSYDVGLGCDIYFEFFKLSPEIKLSNSFGDVLLHDNTPFSSPISRLGVHSLMFSLIFE